MEQPRGQQPALLPDQLPDGGRRARLHRGVSGGLAVRPGRAGAGGCGDPGPGPVPGSGPGRGLCDPERARAGWESTGAEVLPFPFLLSPFPLSPLFPLPSSTLSPLPTPLVSFKNAEAWFPSFPSGGNGSRRVCEAVLGCERSEHSLFAVSPCHGLVPQRCARGEAADPHLARAVMLGVRDGAGNGAASCAAIRASS